jgi:hypothetical protein
LNSYCQNRIFPIIYTIDSCNNDAIIINVNIALKGINNGCPEFASVNDYICTPIIDDVYELQYQVDGNYSFSLPKPIKKIKFEVYKSPNQFCYTNPFFESVKTELIDIPISHGNRLYVSIEVIDSLFNYQIFKNEKLKIKNGKVIFKDGGKSYKLYLKK